MKKTNGSTGTLYWYGAPGIIAESNLAGTPKSEYVFINGKRAARIDLPGNTVHYYLSDHLNSTSMVVSATGVVEDESDYSPFGTEYVVISSGSNHYKFTGKERDSESGLDYFGARYYSNAFGRFLTPDWAAKAISVPYANFGDPQTLNLYGYVRNIPTSLVDGDGHDFVNEGFQDWGFELGDLAWGTQKGEDDAKAQANYQRSVQLQINTASAMATEQGTPHSYSTESRTSQFADWVNHTNQKLDTLLAPVYKVLDAVLPHPQTFCQSGICTEVQIGIVFPTGGFGMVARGITAADGTIIEGFTEHGIDRAIGEGPKGTPGVRAGTKPQAILDALKNPKNITSGVDAQGRPFKIYTGADARVVVNPQTGKIVSVNPSTAAGAH